METLLAALYGSDIAGWLRGSRWGYAGVNTAHVLSIAVLVGAILPLDLRLLGMWPSVPRLALVRVLVPVAATGLAFAIASGLLLFSVRAVEYAQVPVFWGKLALIAVGAGSALLLHARHGWRLETAPDARLAGAGGLSLVCWLGALVCGRMIAFAGN